MSEQISERRKWMRLITSFGVDRNIADRMCDTAHLEGLIGTPAPDGVREALERIKQAEQLAPAGSHEHHMYLSTRLVIEWPTLKAYFALSKPAGEE